MHLIHYSDGHKEHKNVFGKRNGSGHVKRTIGVGQQTTVHVKCNVEGKWCEVASPAAPEKPVETSQYGDGGAD